MRLKLISRLSTVFGAVVLLMLEPSIVAAQSYPVRLIRFVVPFPPGGVNDVIARIAAQEMSVVLGQQWVVENRPGAGGNIGTDFVAKAAPDGYTLLSGGMGSLVMNPIIGNVPYDTLRDFTPIILTATAANVLVVHPSLPVRNVRDLIKLAKARPGELNYGSGGVGSTPHLSGALFATMASVNIVHVPYRGGALATTDLLAGQIQLAFIGIPNAYSHIKNHKLRPLATTGLRRSSALAEVPTVAESGLSGYEVSPWYGVLAPAGTPADVVTKLNTELAKIMRTKEMHKKLVANGADPTTSTPEEYTAQIRADITKWTKVIKGAGIKAQ